MKRKFKEGATKFTFGGVEGEARTNGSDVLVSWCGRKQYLATLGPAVRACVITAVFRAGLLVE